MRFVLFEPFLWDDVVEYPDLGCASLVAACRSVGATVGLISSQARSIDILFDTIVASLIEFASHDRESDLATDARIPRLASLLGSGGTPKAREEIGVAYRALRSRTWATYLSPSSAEDMAMLLREARTLLEESAVGDRSLLDSYLEHLLRLPGVREADMIGVSAYGLQPVNLEIMRAIRGHTGATVVVGGAVTSHLSTAAVEEFASLHVADYLVVGPGELTLPKLLSRSGGKIRVPGLVDLENSEGAEPPLGLRGRVDDLAPPDFSLSSFSDYPAPVPILPVLSSRGCSWRKCEFCSHHASYMRQYLPRDPQKVAEQLSAYSSELGVRHFVLHDEELPPGRMVELAAAIPSGTSGPMSLSAYARPTEGFDEPTVMRAVADGGFLSINWGVESGSLRLLDALGKGTQPETIESVLHRAASAGIANICWMMIGVPTETERDMADTIQMMCRVASEVDTWLVSPFSLQKDSSMIRNASKWGLTFDERETVDEFSNRRGGVEYSKGPSEAARRERVAIIENLLASDIRFSKPFSAMLPHTNRARLIPFLLRAERAVLDPRELGRARSIALIGEARAVGLRAAFWMLPSGNALRISAEDAGVLQELLRHSNERGEIERRFLPTQFASFDPTSLMCRLAAVGAVVGFND